MTKTLLKPKVISKAERERRIKAASVSKEIVEIDREIAKCEGMVACPHFSVQWGSGRQRIWERILKPHMTKAMQEYREKLLVIEQDIDMLKAKNDS